MVLGLSALYPISKASRITHAFLKMLLFVIVVLRNMDGRVMRTCVGFGGIICIQVLVIIRSQKLFRRPSRRFVNFPGSDKEKGCFESKTSDMSRDFCSSANSFLHSIPFRTNQQSYPRLLLPCLRDTALFLLGECT